jgi:membrane associated rhomboid family serine protease
MTSSPPPQPDSGEREVPTCYRHPNREAYVRCSRCEKRICPDCMREAAVGHQCVECVAEGQKSMRQARTIFGGKVTTAPYVTYTLLTLMGLGFLVQMADPGVTSAFGMAGAPVAMGEWYRMITSAFLHEQLYHIGFNMLALWILGPNLEAALGRARFLALYLISALAGSTLSYLLAPVNQFSLGASGAIFGLFGALAILMRRMRYDMRPIMILLGINLVITFLPGLNIAWQAHLGGLIAGAAIAFGMVHAPRERRTLVQTATCAAVLLVLVVACVVRTVQLL